MKLKEGKHKMVHLNIIRKQAGFSCILFLWKSGPHPSQQILVLTTEKERHCKDGKQKETFPRNTCT